MNKTLLLTIVFIKSSLQRIQSKYYENSEKAKKARKISFIFLFVVLVVIVGYFSSNLIDILEATEQETLYIHIILFLTLIVAVVQGIFSSVNVLYFSKDSENILPLPIKPYQIILARTNEILLVQYFIELVIGIVPFIIYGTEINSDYMFYLSVLISLILLPILPIILVSTIVMILMCLSKKVKNKNRFQFFIIILLMIIMLGASYLMVGGISLSENQTASILGSLEKMVNYFPTIKFAFNAITSNSIMTMLKEFAKIILITVAGYIIYALLAQKLYFKGLVGCLYSGKRKRKKQRIKIKTNKTSIARSYVGKEFKTLIRNPIYLSQCVLPVILLPTLYMVLLAIFINKETANTIQNYLSQLNLEGVMLLLVIGVIQFMSMSTYVAAIAISRDGKNAVFMKYIPVSLYKQYMYKTIPNIILNIYPMIVVIIAAKYIFDISIIDMMVALIVSVIMNITQSFLQVLVDLKRPKLKWDSEYAIVKQNINLVFPIVFNLFSILLLTIYAETTQKLSVYIILAVISVVYIIVIILTNLYLYNHQNDLAEKIE